MDVRVITLRYQEGLQGFPEEALRRIVNGYVPSAAPRLRVNQPDLISPRCALRGSAAPRLRVNQPGLGTGEGPRGGAEARMGKDGYG